MENGLQQIIELSNFYGKDKTFVIAGGGNTSYKTDKLLYVKASGTSLATITEDGFCVLNREKLNALSGQSFPDDTNKREAEVKAALLNSRIDPDLGLRPSVEASIHNLFDYTFIVHTHPTLVNGLMCSNDAKSVVKSFFGDEALFIPYIDPGYILFKEVEKKVKVYTEKYGSQPKITFLQNHGIFVAANTSEEIKEIYSEVISKIKSKSGQLPQIELLPLGKLFEKVLPAVRMIFSRNNLNVALAANNTILEKIINNRNSYETIANPFTPDQIVYGLSEYLFIENTSSADSVIAEIQQKTADFINRKGVAPKIIFIKGEGIIAIEDSAATTKTLLDVVNDFISISLIAETFGGQHPMSSAQIDFISNWEVENYRKKVSQGSGSQGQVRNKVIIVTGAAQGFGAGVANMLFHEGANIVIADLNRKKGEEFAKELNLRGQKNSAIFISANVGDAPSVERMISQTVFAFGGLDVLISNAGILRAGSLEEMTPETFELMTKVNYSGYFLCAKYAKPVMKLQNQYNPDFYMDIVQVNSKSGLKGSNKNFAYAGGKFGGIGLTQSFALELMPFNVKVNSICPGNFFDGPLWADPENGLFVQYLNAGKVPGAKTINDVKAFYEAQVPAGRGCTSEDVAKAILYVIDQHYETGQAVPVTGGQNMLK